MKAPAKFFTQVGLSAEVQSDHGSNFTSGLFENMIKLLGTTQYWSTTHHRQSKRVKEKFHLTLKTMILTYCLDMGSEWDDGTDPLSSVRDNV